MSQRVSVPVPNQLLEGTMFVQMWKIWNLAVAGCFKGD